MSVCVCLFLRDSLLQNQILFLFSWFVVLFIDLWWPDMSDLFGLKGIKVTKNYWETVFFYKLWHVVTQKKKKNQKYWISEAHNVPIFTPNKVKLFLLTNRFTASLTIVYIFSTVDYICNGLVDFLKNNFLVCFEISTTSYSLCFIETSIRRSASSQKTLSEEIVGKHRLYGSP